MQSSTALVDAVETVAASGVCTECVVNIVRTAGRAMNEKLVGYVQGYTET